LRSIDKGVVGIGTRRPASILTNMGWLQPIGVERGYHLVEAVDSNARPMKHVHRACWVFAAWAAVVSLTAQSTSPSRYTIAFKAFPPSNTDIFIAAADGSDARPLAPDPALDYNASFSADGQWIVFTSHRAGSADLYRIRPDGTGLERLTDDPAFDDQGAFSPDGRQIAFVSTRRGQADIWALDLETRKTRLVIGGPAGDFRPAWSPDGQWIAFVSDRQPAARFCPNTTEPGPGPFVTPQYTSVFVARADGRDLRRITLESEVAGGPRWSADGSRLIAYSAALDAVCRGDLMFGRGPSQIVSIDWRTGRHEPMTKGQGLKVFPSSLPDGRIAYVTPAGLAFSDGRRDISGEFGRPDWNKAGSMVVFHREADRASDQDRPFERWHSPDQRFALLRLSGHASFAPAGDRLVFAVNNYAGDVRNGRLVVAAVDGSNRRTIYEGPVTDDLAGPAWSPRGDKILFGIGGFFQRASIRTARLMTIRPDGNQLTPLTTETGNAGMPSWSPDGTQVVYRFVDGSTRGLRILDVAAKTTRALETGSSYDTFPSWSPRGDWIAFTSKRDGDYEIYRIKPDGTQLQRLTRLPGPDAHPSFSPDGEWIAFATGSRGFKDEAIGLVIGALPPQFQPYGEIAVMRVDGSDLHVLTDDSIEQGTPVWVPAAQRLDK
jgi:Tol biopolymer transport system component